MTNKDISPHEKPAMSLVLGGGCYKFPGHIGFLKAAKEIGLHFGQTTGISIGSTIAAFYKAGYEPDDMYHEIRRFLVRFKAQVGWPSPFAVATGEVLDTTPIFLEVVKESGLILHPELQLVAFDIVSKKPKVFCKADYDRERALGTGDVLSEQEYLAKGLAASSALPDILRPIPHCHQEKVGNRQEVSHTIARLKDNPGAHGVYVDGWKHNPNAFDLSVRAVIISKLGIATEMPLTRFGQLSFADEMFQVFELLYGRLIKDTYPVPKPEEGCLQIQSGIPSIASVAFDLPGAVFDEMLAYGYKTTKDALKKAREDGWLTDEYLGKA